MWAGGGRLGGAGVRAPLAGSETATRTGACPMGKGCGVDGAGTHTRQEPAGPMAKGLGACPMARGLGPRHNARCLPAGFARACISVFDCTLSDDRERDLE